MEAFRVGFAHGRDKALDHIDSAISICEMAIADNPNEASLRIRLTTLRQLRLAISTVKPDIAGQK